MDACLDLELLEDFLDQRLDVETSARVARHLDGCSTCTGLRTALKDDRDLERELRTSLSPSALTSARPRPIQPPPPRPQPARS